MNKFLKVSLVTALALATITPAFALSISPLASTSSTGTTLANAWLGSSSGLTVVGPISYVGDNNQAGTYSGFALTSSSSTSPNVSIGDGIVLTTGTANVPNSNTSSGFGISTSTGSSSTISNITGLTTNDTNSISFSFTVESGITSISSNFIFGSDEFPEYAGTSFADGFAFVVDGVNFAKFSDGTNVSLATLSSNANLLNNNAGIYGIEYDGFTAALGIVGILNSSLTEHTLEIVIADTGDSILDSGVFLSALSGGNDSGGGGVKPPNPSAVPVPAALPLMATAFGLFGLSKRRKNA